MCKTIKVKEDDYFLFHYIRKLCHSQFPNEIACEPNFSRNYLFFKNVSEQNFVISLTVDKWLRFELQAEILQ